MINRKQKPQLRKEKKETKISKLNKNIVECQRNRNKTEQTNLKIGKKEPKIL